MKDQLCLFSNMMCLTKNFHTSLTLKILQQENGKRSIPSNLLKQHQELQQNIYNNLNNWIFGQPETIMNFKLALFFIMINLPYGQYQTKIQLNATNILKLTIVIRILSLMVQ
jgi:hypothetical protein